MDLALNNTQWLIFYKTLSKKQAIAFALNYYMQDTKFFTYAEVDFIRVTILGDRRLIAPNITAQLNQCHEKMFQHPL